MIKRYLALLVGALAVLASTSASAYLWESQAQVDQRYGPATKTTGYPHRRRFYYAFEGLEIRINFYNGISEEESYMPTAVNGVFDDLEIQRLLEANAGRSKWRQQAKDDGVIDAKNGRAYANYFPDPPKPTLRLYTHESIDHQSESVSNSLARTQKEETFEGVAALTKEEKSTRVIVHSGDRVVYIPWSTEGDRDRAPLVPGKTYRITVRDEESIDEEDAMAFVSARDHKDYFDAVNDSKSYLLARVEDGDVVVFDRSVCEVHHAKMSKVMAEVRYGMWAPQSPGEAQCAQNFPHYRDYIRAGCLVDEPKKAPRYVCPECVAACKRINS